MFLLDSPYEPATDVKIKFSEADFVTHKKGKAEGNLRSYDLLVCNRKMSQIGAAETLV